MGDHMIHQPLTNHPCNHSAHDGDAIFCAHIPACCKLVNRSIQVLGVDIIKGADVASLFQGTPKVLDAVGMGHIPNIFIS